MLPFFKKKERKENSHATEKPKHKIKLKSTQKGVIVSCIPTLFSALIPNGVRQRCENQQKKQDKEEEESDENMKRCCVGIRMRNHTNEVLVL